MEIKVNTRINGKRAVVTMNAEESQIVDNEQVVYDNGLILSEIERLKSELKDSDYKVIKCRGDSRWCRDAIRRGKSAQGTPSVARQD